MNINREPSDKWPYIERSVSIDVDPAAVHFDWKELTEATRRVALKAMTEKLFDDNPLLDGYVPTPPTWREKFQIYRERVRDAWAVLLGRAQIGDGW